MSVKTLLSTVNIDAVPNMSLSGLLFESFTDSISAAGSGQSNGTQLTTEVNRITTCTAGQGVVLPASVAGLTIYVINHSAANCMVYGLGADQIDDQTNTVGVNQMPSSTVLYVCVTAGNWYSEGLATGFLRGIGLQTLSFADNLTATGTGQSNALPLTALTNRLTSVPSGTGVNLPTSAAGLAITLINAGALPVLVYPAQSSSDTINSFSAATGVPFVVNSINTFYCETAGAWQCLATQPANSVYNVDSTATSHSVTAANITGAEVFVCLNLTGAAGAGVNLTLPTVAQLVAALHSPIVGSSYTLRIINNGNASTVWTVLTATGWTLNGTMTIALNTYREFVVTLTSISAATLQSLGQVTVGAI